VAVANTRASDLDKGIAPLDAKMDDLEVVWTHVPLLAGISKDLKKVYIDTSLDKVITVQGKQIDVVKQLTVHELTEYAAMQGGLSYADAHGVALTAEHALLKTQYAIDENGIAEYEAYFLSKEHSKDCENCFAPADIYPGPYEASGMMGKIAKPTS